MLHLLTMIRSGCYRLAGAFDVFTRPGRAGHFRPFAREARARSRGLGGLHCQPSGRVFILPPPDAAYPATVVVRAREPRLMFDLPSEAGPHGPQKEIRLPRPEKTSLYVAIFPDRDSRDQDDALDVEFTDARGERQTQRVPVHVVDQDRDRPVSFPITVDFTQDRTRFFSDEARQAIVVRAAEDWAYFFDGTNLAPTAAGAETTLIWNPDGFNTSRRVTNEKPYTGYLLHAYGIDRPLLRSGGEPSCRGGFQSQDDKSVPIRRIRGRIQRQLQSEGLDRGSRRC